MDNQGKTSKRRENVRVKDANLEEVLAGKRRLLFDGGMGTMLQKLGIPAGELPDLLCLSKPGAITEVHAAYVKAGSQAVTTNTFGANSRKLAGIAAVDDIYAAAVECARGAGARYIAADIGPTGELLEPFGDLEFDEAYELFAEQARAADAAGADIIIIETMAAIDEIRAAATAAIENSALPVFATMTFGIHGRTLMGDTPTDAVGALESLGVDAVGINCSLGPADLAPLVTEMLECATKPVIMQANAGLPQLVNGETTYSIGPAQYAAAVKPLVDAGVGIVGGCCGTNPDYIRELAAFVDVG